MHKSGRGRPACRGVTKLCKLRSLGGRRYCSLMIIFGGFRATAGRLANLVCVILTVPRVHPIECPFGVFSNGLSMRLASALNSQLQSACGIFPRFCKVWLGELFFANMC
jgi:hypothetical protein